VESLVKAGRNVARKMNVLLTPWSAASVQNTAEAEGAKKMGVTLGSLMAVFVQDMVQDALKKDACRQVSAVDYAGSMEGAHDALKRGAILAPSQEGCV
jgi:hypothetical protein